MKADQLDETQLIYKNFFVDTKHITIFIFCKIIFYYEQSHSPLIGAKKFVEINNNKLRVLNDF